MPSKAEKTTAFIIETVAPIFTKHGYVGTSMSALTEATGLTKGALYGNFKNKEDLALRAFDFSSSKLIEALDKPLDAEGSSLDRIFGLTHFFKTYDEFIEPLGGCPLLRTGVDAKHNNADLSAAAREVCRIIEGKIAATLEDGVNAGELRLPVPPLQFAKQLFTMLQGAVAMFTTTGDRKYLINTVAYLDVLIKREIKK